MTEAQSDLAFALKMYGEKCVEHAAQQDSTSFDDMCFWQNQLWMCAQAVAREQAQ